MHEFIADMRTDLQEGVDILFRKCGIEQLSGLREVSFLIIKQIDCDNDAEQEVGKPFKYGNGACRNRCNDICAAACNAVELRLKLICEIVCGVECGIPDACEDRVDLRLIVLERREMNGDPVCHIGQIFRQTDEQVFDAGDQFRHNGCDQADDRGKQYQDRSGHGERTFQARMRFVFIGVARELFFQPVLQRTHQVGERKTDQHRCEHGNDLPEYCNER